MFTVLVIEVCSMVCSVRVKVFIILLALVTALFELNAFAQARAYLPEASRIPEFECDLDGTRELDYDEFNGRVGGKGRFLRGGNQVEIDWNKCPIQYVYNGTSNGGARMNFIDPPYAMDVQFTIIRNYGKHGTSSPYGGLSLRWAKNIKWNRPRYTPYRANRFGPYVFDCTFNGYEYSCTWQY